MAAPANALPTPRTAPREFAAKRILLVTPSLFVGGVDVVVKQLALALRAEGREVAVLSMLDPTAHREELERAGVPVESLSMQRGGANLMGIVRFIRSVRAFGPDVIHAHMFHASVLSRLLRPFIRARIVCSVHNEIECSHLRRTANLREWIFRLTDRGSDCTIAVSRRVRDRYVRLRLSRPTMLVVDNGVDGDLYRPDSTRRSMVRAAMGWEQKFVWLAIGRLELQKDYPTLLRAFLPIHQRWPSARLAIAGEGRLRPEIEQVIAQLGLSSSVTLLGVRPDIQDLLNAADALAQSSEWEGCQLTLLEAAAVGKPMVATEVGASPEIVLPYLTGFLAPPRDPEALSAAMSRMMSLSPIDRAAMGAEARTLVTTRYSLPRMHQRHQEIYDRVMVARL